MKNRGIYVLQGIFAISKPHLLLHAILIAIVSMYGASMLSPGAPQVGYEGYLHIIVAIVLSAAGAGALNHYYDRDIDTKINRTHVRPIPSGRLSARIVLAYGITLSCISVIYGVLLINEISGFFLAMSIFTYVVLYTIWLKRRSIFNIVVVGIGNSAICWTGWAAAIGTLDLLGLLVGLLFFIYYPSHYWSMSVLVRDKHEQANVRMLPFVIGMHRTSKYILVNTLILVPYSLALYAFGMGIVYLGFAAATGGLMLFYHYRFTRNSTDEFAWKSLKVTGPCMRIMVLAVVLDAAFHMRI